jgi:hypothetical protein
MKRIFRYGALTAESYLSPFPHTTNLPPKQRSHCRDPLERILRSRMVPTNMKQLAITLSLAPRLCFVLVTLSSLFLCAQELRFGGSVSDASEAAIRIQIAPQAFAKAYEESWITNLRSLNMAQAIYRSEHVQKGFARKLEALGPKGAGHIEPVLASGKKSGYRITLAPGKADAHGVTEHYTISARPLKSIRVPGRRSFVTDETGIIRATADNRAATQSDPPIQ